MPFFGNAKGAMIPISANFDPLELLTNSSEIARWSNEKLPNDRTSVENAVIITNCKRWPLIIDPQLQGKTILLFKSRYHMDQKQRRSLFEVGSIGSKRLFGSN